MKRIAGGVVAMALLLAGCGSAAGGDPAAVDWHTTPTTANELIHVPAFAPGVKVRYLVSAGNESAVYSVFDQSGNGWSAETPLPAGSSWESEAKATNDQMLMVRVTSDNQLRGTIECAIEVDGKILVHLKGTTTYMCAVSGMSNGTS